MVSDEHGLCTAPGRGYGSSKSVSRAIIYKHSFRASEVILVVNVRNMSKAPSSWKISTSSEARDLAGVDGVIKCQDASQA